MSSPLPTLPAPADQYLVSHGKSGAIGVFTAETALRLRRGAEVVIETSRGLEIGKVLRPASLSESRLLNAAGAGSLRRAVNHADAEERGRRHALAEEVFTTSRAWAKRDGLPIDILDADVLFDGSAVILQFVGAEDGLDHLAKGLEAHFPVAVRFENLALPVESEHGGCDKPDCGRQAGGGCTTCSTGGGCSSCGSGVDLRAYFSHLRGEMESRRTPLA